ncbi:MAG: hypothetical protein RSD04_03245 [Clostridia bacterium]
MDEQIDIGKPRKFCGKLGAVIGYFGIIGVLASFFLVLTPVVNFLAIGVLLMIVICTFGLIFVFVPDFGKAFDNTEVFTAEITAFSEQYALTIILVTLAILVLALALTFCLKGTKKFKRVAGNQVVTIALTLVSLVLYFVSPMITKFFAS